MKPSEILDKEGSQDVFNVLNHEDYLPIKMACNELLSYNNLQFCTRFDYWIAACLQMHLQIDNGEELTERAFFNYIIYRISKAAMIIDNYFDHTKNIGKEINQNLEDYYHDNSLKIYFIKSRLRHSAFISNDINDIEELKKSARKRLNQNKILKHGKYLNISDRYFVACELLNVEEVIRELNILSTEKHILLSLILGCNQQTARELYNGTHQKRTPVQENLVDAYLKNIKHK